MHRVSTLWKANAIALVSSFCVMVIELLAVRILAPHIGVSLYSWTSIIGVILSGIALGNYIGGRIADRRASHLLLAVVFLTGALATIAILPTTRIITSAGRFRDLPLMLDLVMKVSSIFLLPAIILSMISPIVIKLTLANLGQTGGTVGTIYAFSTVGAILGTFMTGFYLILWFGISMTVWLVAAILILIGILVWFFWKTPVKWNLFVKNRMMSVISIIVILVYIFSFHSKESWQENYTRESSYYSIRVVTTVSSVKALYLDYLLHSLVKPNDPTALGYDYLNIFAEIVRYITKENMTPRVLHLGGGGYSFPRHMETVYPGSVNEVVEIDPAVTEVAHEELGLPLETSIKTYNQDARLFLIQRKAGEPYDIVIGDVFNSHSTPYHLTTLEFDKLVKSNMEDDGVYLVNIIDDYARGRYLPSVIYTLEHTFNYVYLFRVPEMWELGKTTATTFVIAATNRHIDLSGYEQFVTESGKKWATGKPVNGLTLKDYLAQRDPILLTDDYVPTDILIARLLR